jgi:hypothetical protein
VNPGRQPPDRHESPPAPVLFTPWIEWQWNPDLHGGQQGYGVIRVQHTDDLVALSIQLDRVSHHVSIATEPARPERVTQERYVAARGSQVLRVE